MQTRFYLVTDSQWQIVRKSSVLNKLVNIHPELCSTPCSACCAPALSGAIYPPLHTLDAFITISDAGRKVANDSACWRNLSARNDNGWAIQRQQPTWCSTARALRPPPDPASQRLRRLQTHSGPQASSDGRRSGLAGGPAHQLRQSGQQQSGRVLGEPISRPDGSSSLVAVKCGLPPHVCELGSSHAGLASRTMGLLSGEGW